MIVVSHGIVPADGYRSGEFTNPVKSGWRYVQPNIDSGKRITGTVTISPLPIREDGIPEGDPNAFAAVPMRLLVDGVPQSNWTIDTTKWPDGSHVLGVQVMSAIHKIENGSRVVVFNNSGVPFTDKSNQAVVGHSHSSFKANSLAWARVNVIDPAPYPLGHGAAKHPVPTEADSLRLANDNIWWVEGLNHQGTGLYTNFPILVKNATGDYFIKQWRFGHGLNSADALRFVKVDPSFDGPRGICMLSPYTTLVAGTKILGHHRGWLGVDIAGRLVDVEISGAVTTIFGPRSVAGAVQTDPDLTNFTLEQRIAAGEKEWVGDSSNKLVMPQDLWPQDDDITIIADTGAGKVQRVSRSQAAIVGASTCLGVTSVWRGFGVEWWVSPNSLWRNGVKVRDIPGAFWVRGDEARNAVYVLTNSMAVYEITPAGDVATKRLPGVAGYTFDFVFLEVDVHGNTGPRGRVYFSMSNSYDSNTGIHYADPGVWAERNWVPRVFNSGDRYASYQATNDIFGHYLWGFAIHPEEAMWVSVGTVNSSWKVATAHLGESPVLDPAIDPAVYGLGNRFADGGKRDRRLGVGAILGYMGHGGLGYSVDMRRNGTVADFRQLLDPFDDTLTEQEKDGVARFFWAQRTRSHFPPAVVEPAPPPPPVTATGTGTVTSAASGTGTGTGTNPPSTVPVLTETEIVSLASMLRAWGVPEAKITAVSTVLAPLAD